MNAPSTEDPVSGAAEPLLRIETPIGDEELAAVVAVLLCRTAAASVPEHALRQTTWRLPGDDAYRSPLSWTTRLSERSAR